MKSVLVLGANGFIGHHLCRHLLATTDWRVVALDLQDTRLGTCRADPRFRFVAADIRHADALEAEVAASDAVVPLAAIATPAAYLKEPLRVFELDFEANLAVVRLCVRHGRRLVFPSSSEVYGMCPDAEFDPDTSPLVLGPVHRQRWIYACSKQLLDRVIWAYGQEGRLDFTLFRPFNWIGPGLDAGSDPGGARVVAEFRRRLARGQDLCLVDGGRQRRSFTDIADGLDGLVRILKNPGGVASGKVYNLGNPANDTSVRELALLLLELAHAHPATRDAARHTRLVEVTAAEYYGEGYQDVPRRVPRIDAACHDLGWEPRVALAESLRRILESGA